VEASIDSSSNIESFSTSRGKRWELLHSLWIGWTFTLGFFSWVAFLYIGVRARKIRWVLWGLIYLIPFVYELAARASTKFWPSTWDYSWQGTAITVSYFVIGAVSVYHAFRVRKEYLVRLDSLLEGGKAVLGDLKTPKSRRSARLTGTATDALRRHLERQLAEMERMGSLYQPGGLVFATESSTLINPSNLRNRSFKPLLRRAGLPDICFHDLRHTCATLLLSQGTHPKLVQELLGHATIAMTLDTYSYFLPSMGDQTVRAMEAALS
jgi:hypothetical protein